MELTTFLQPLHLLKIVVVSVAIVSIIDQIMKLREQVSFIHHRIGNVYEDMVKIKTSLGVLEERLSSKVKNRK